MALRSKKTVLLFKELLIIYMTKFRRLTILWHPLYVSRESFVVQIMYKKVSKVSVKHVLYIPLMAIASCSYEWPEKFALEYVMPVMNALKRMVLVVHRFGSLATPITTKS